MKKLVSIALALVLVLSLSVTAFAASNAPSVLYIDVAGVADSGKTISSVQLWVYSTSESGIANKQMTHVSGTIYSYDISSVTDPSGAASYEVIYTDGTRTETNATTAFENGKNLFTATDRSRGTWSVYTANAIPVENGNHSVTATYKPSENSNPVYKVDISWGSMAFTYTAASKGTWNVDSHIYEGASKGGWSWAEGANQIKVTNHSNAGITVTPAYTAESAYSAISMTFADTNLSLTTADNGEGNNGAGKATSGTITVTPSGVLPEDTNGKIGTITLSIAGVENSGSSTDTPQWTTVTNADDLVAAIKNGGNIRLGESITVENYINVYKNVNLDLNNCTLNVYVNVGKNFTLTIKNGEISYTADCPVNNTYGGNITIENCTLTGHGNAFYHTKGNSTLINCTLNGALIVEIGTVTLSGIKWGHGLESEDFTGIAVADGGSVICDFDPTNNIYDGNGTVTDNGDGTWTVTKAS